MEEVLQIVAEDDISDVTAAAEPVEPVAVQQLADLMTV